MISDVTLCLYINSLVTTAIAVTLCELGGFIIQYRNIVNNWLYFFMHRTMDHGTTEIHIHMQRVYRTMKKPQRIIDGLIKTGQGGSCGLLLDLLNSRGREH